jgi:hypothetical protein
MTEERLTDRVRIADQEQVTATLRSRETHFRGVCEWIGANVERTAEAAILHRILWGAANYLHIAAENVDDHASILALATRNLYELRLRVEYMIADTEKFIEWQAEAATDKIEVLEGILELRAGDGSESQRAILTAEIARIRGALDRHHFSELLRIPSSGTIAKALGRTDEHRSLFKLLSKLVHPSSYLINDYANAASEEVYTILQVHVQVYAWDLFSRSCDLLEIPEEVRKFDFGNFA